MKICSRCKIRKRKSDFQVRKASNDGLTAACKSCLSEYDKKRAKLPHRVKAREQYQKTIAGKIASTKAKKKWIKRNVIKRAANILVGNALRSGKLIKKPCEVCGATYRIHGHHDDYANPLKVRWLCPNHHNDWHRKNGEGKNST